jgi:hypothetical protein
MLLEVIARARRRLFLNGLAVEGAHAISAALGMLVLLVLVGADALDWRWLVIPPGIVIVVGVCLARRRLPGAYAAAQVVDSRLHLADILSTAVFFGSTGRRPPDEGIRQAQRQRALAVARTVNLGAAIPVRAPRALYFSMILAVLAGGLMALRYYSEGRLDLRRPMVRGFGQLLRSIREELAKVPEALQKEIQDRLENDTGSDAAGNSADGGRSNSADGELATDSGSAADGRQGEASERTSANRQEQQEAANPGSSSSIFSKLSNTVDNLFSVLKPAAGREGSRQASDGEGATPGSARQMATSAGNRQQQDGQVAGSQDGDQGSNSQGVAHLSGKSQNSDSEGAGQAGSGAGANEGDKEIKTAEQLAAMGKISVILGKRSENVSGSAAVEVVSSGEQQLKTPYERRRAQHVQVQAKTERDEVPPAFREFVQQYFKQVRKTSVSRARK